MHEPKPFASLTSGLLARKGGASPAMRRQVMLGAMPSAIPHDDLGWNDMGEDSARQSDPLIGLTPMGGAPVSQAPTPIVADTPVVEDAPVPVVVEQRRALAEQVSAPTPKKVAAKAVIAAVPDVQRSKAAFTLRLDPERHLRLRLACAVGNRSAQQIVTDALDAFLESQPQIDALAEQLPRPGGKRK
ncbi:MAG: hypothetical protein ACSLE1_21230 [Sphingobium sp.]